MTVYVLCGEIQYEGSTVLGVYSSAAAAESAADSLELEDFDGYTVIPMELDAGASAQPFIGPFGG